MFQGLLLKLFLVPGEISYNKITLSLKPKIFIITIITIAKMQENKLIF